MGIVIFFNVKALANYDRPNFTEPYDLDLGPVILVRLNNRGIDFDTYYLAVRLVPCQLIL